MRGLLVLVGALWLAGMAAQASAFPVATAADRVPIAVGDGCGPGSHWVPPGYAKHAKWRPGHCAPN